LPGISPYYRAAAGPALWAGFAFNLKALAVKGQKLNRSAHSQTQKMAKRRQFCLLLLQAKALGPCSKKAAC